jgi:1-acyl-sn-glycerol-3-phosphate acyltransferase
MNSTRTSSAENSDSLRRESVPVISQVLLRWFGWYARRYVRRHFHALRLSRAPAFTPTPGVPLVFYSNHASWWDPLVGLLIARHAFPQRKVFAPMDAQALESYAFFKKLGVFGVEQDSARGAVHFLRMSEAILARSDSALWLTPQGKFADVRERPLEFKSGIGHLPQLTGQAIFVPVAMEYCFWEERSPEILVRFGTAELVTSSRALRPAEWTSHFSRNLEATQLALAEQALRRCSDEFVNVLAGRTGVGGCYDAWRSVKARLRGRAFSPAHSDL